MNRAPAMPVMNVQSAPTAAIPFIAEDPQVRTSSLCFEFRRKVAMGSSILLRNE